MSIKQIFEGCLDEGKIPFSFEFFPPKTDQGFDKLFESISKLKPLNPAYVSVTYGAGGSTRDNTHKIVKRIKEEGLEVVAHLTCEGSSLDEINRIIDSYNELGIHNILALKGDVPKEKHASNPAFTYASDLVAHIKKRHPHFSVGVAGFPEGHPSILNRLHELDFLKIKVDAGADYIVSQMFFDNHDFHDFRERCDLLGIRAPIIAGIMPVTTQKGMERMAELSPRTRFPARLLKSIQRAKDDDAIRAIGVQYATEQINDLIYNKVAGVHLYTLNASDSSIEICKNLGLDSLSVAR